MKTAKVLAGATLVFASCTLMIPIAAAAEAGPSSSTSITSVTTPNATVPYEWMEMNRWFGPDPQTYNLCHATGVYDVAIGEAKSYQCFQMSGGWRLTEYRPSAGY